MEEVTQWKEFITPDGTTYDLSHLNARWVEYLDESNKNQPITYKFFVTYGLHCFTKDSDDLSQAESELLMYNAPKESRPFNLERYELSRKLPAIIASLGERETLVCHAGYGKYAVVKILKSDGCEVDYFVPFAVFREDKKFRIHVQSAYPKEERLGRVKKVRFFVIAKNLLLKRKLPRP